MKWKFPRTEIAFRCGGVDRRAIDHFRNRLNPFCCSFFSISSFLLPARRHSVTGGFRGQGRCWSHRSRRSGLRRRIIRVLDRIVRDDGLQGDNRTRRSCVRWCRRRDEDRRRGGGSTVVGGGANVVGTSHFDHTRWSAAEEPWSTAGGTVVDGGGSSGGGILRRRDVRERRRTNRLEPAHQAVHLHAPVREREVQHHAASDAWPGP